MSTETWVDLGRNGWQPSGGAQWRRQGESWCLAWPDRQVGIIVDRPRENQFGLYAEVTIERLPRNGTDAGHLHWSRLKLNDTEDREKVARSLTKRTGENINGVAFDWSGVIQHACVLTARESRKGEPCVNLSSVPVPPKRVYLLERLLPANETSLLYADGGAGKSLIALAVAMAVQAGVNLPGGLRPTHQANVLYLDWETHEVTHARRLTLLANGLGIPVPPIHYLRMSTSLVMSLARIAAEVDRLKAELLIVDSAGFAIHEDINDAGAATEMYNSIRGLGVTGLVLHHVNKAAAERTEGTVKPFGAAYFWNGARNAWEVRSTASSTDISAMSLWHRKDNDGGLLAGPVGLQVHFASDAIRLSDFDVADDAELAQFGGARFVLRGVLRHGARTVAELVDETDLDKDTIRKALNRGTEFVRVPDTSGRGKETRWGLAQ